MEKEWESIKYIDLIGIRHVPLPKKRGFKGAWYKGIKYFFVEKRVCSGNSFDK